MEAALALVLTGWSYASGASAVCASCHRKIYDAYRATPMARSARKLDPAAVPEQFGRASFTHAPSGFHYDVSLQQRGYVLGFGKTGGPSGSKVLAYAVGSGTRAFSYLIADDGYLYEAPVAYYAIGHSWGLPPGYEKYSYPYLTRPIVPGCLSCHASFLQVEPLTLNRYASPAFLEDGVACERCHGNGERHVARMQSGDLAGDPRILNPARLAPERRDSICAQCHLTGDVRVMRRGSDWRSFQPGSRLSDYQTVFVRSPKAEGMTVTSHVENLAASACKRKSGDQLWCGSCHDPHVVPTPAQAPAWFRGRCLACHTAKPCTATQAARQNAKDDCVACHMPKSPASDAQHTVFADHSIPRRPRGKAANPAALSDAGLVPFDGSAPASRDLALAYAIAAIGKSGGADHTRALGLLERAAREAPDDVEVLVSLAEIYRNDGKNLLALPLYERAIALDPAQVTASVGLGGIMMERGDYAAAVELWKDALSKNAGLQLVRLNFALALWKTGRHDAAEANLKKALELNPAFVPSRELADQLSHIERR
jgi:cytochrome c-type biogenesis protein CcmH/NrfG